MLEIKRLQKPIEEEFIYYKSYYKNSLKSKTKILDTISNIVHYKKGNDLVPSITLLSAKLVGKINENTYTAASIIDLLYTATLIHEDVEDNSFEKKGFLNLKHLWKSKLAVLMGDYFLAKGLLLSVKNKTYDLLEYASNAVKGITEGELYYAQYCRDMHSNSEEYLNIMNKKTAALFSACTAVGAISAQAEKNSVERISSFGKNFGLAFHIYQDINKYNQNNHKLTLPNILLAENKTFPQEKNLPKPLSNRKSGMINYLETNNGIINSLKMLEFYKSKALDDLSVFPYNETRTVLTNLINSIN